MLQADLNRYQAHHSSYGAFGEGNRADSEGGSHPRSVAIRLVSICHIDRRALHIVRGHSSNRESGSWGFGIGNGVQCGSLRRGPRIVRWCTLDDGPPKVNSWHNQSREGTGSSDSHSSSLDPDRHVRMLVGLEYR